MNNLSNLAEDVNPLNSVERTAGGIERDQRIAGLYIEHLKFLRGRGMVFRKIGSGEMLYRNLLDMSRYSAKGLERIKIGILKRFDHSPKFGESVLLTLTFDPKRYSRYDAWQILGKEIRRFENALNEYRKRKGLTKRLVYFWINEGQKNGYPAPHVVFVGIKYLAAKHVLESLWRHGFIDVRMTRGENKVSRYVVKYLTKMGTMDDWLCWMWFFKIRLYGFSVRFASVVIVKLHKWVLAHKGDTKECMEYMIRLDKFFEDWNLHQEDKKKANPG